MQYNAPPYAGRILSPGSNSPVAIGHRAPCGLLRAYYASAALAGDDGAYALLEVVALGSVKTVDLHSVEASSERSSDPWIERCDTTEMKIWGRLTRGLGILWARLTAQGIRTTALWASDHVVRILAGAPIPRLSQITPQLHLGGQYRRRGWTQLASRGITAVVNMRIEFDDFRAGIAPSRYLHLPTVDDEPPTIAQLHAGVAFTSQEIHRGGGVYIHCGAGVGRAATLVAAYLVSTGLTPRQAWTRISTVRPFIRPRPAQMEQIERFAFEL